MVQFLPFYIKSAEKIKQKYPRPPVAGGPSEIAGHPLIRNPDIIEKPLFSSLYIASDSQNRVMAPETEGVGQNLVDDRFTGGIGHVVQVALRIRVL
jgi:hypothetical protein